MKSKIKGLLLACCMMAAVVAIPCFQSAAAATDATAEATDTTAADTYKSAAESLISQIAGLSAEEITTYESQGEAFTTSALQNWEGVKEELGAYQEIIDQTVTEDDNLVTVLTNAKFEKGTASIELILDTEAQAYSSLNYNVNYTLGQKMQQAGLNTLMGVGIVFIMLIFLSGVINLLGYVPKLFNKKTAQTASPAPVAVPVQNSIAEEELVDDGELVAVIAAAIAAAENTSTDGFTVRSIKKANKWRRA